MTNFKLFLPHFQEESKRIVAYRQISGRSGLVYISVARAGTDTVGERSTVGRVARSVPRVSSQQHFSTPVVIPQEQRKWGCPRAPAGRLIIGWRVASLLTPTRVKVVGSVQRLGLVSILFGVARDSRPGDLPSRRRP
jgi:hypothetical protein